jgi:serine/threonine protein kinase
VAVSILIKTLTIKQPNVIRVIEFREMPEPMIIMDYYNLGNIMEAGVAYDQYVTVVGQILDGLHHLHAKGVAHRDLKPENFLVEKIPFFKVVITDFGLSKVVTDTTLLRTFCGTLKYLAPEVFPCISDGYRPSMDVWALGVIAFEWLYGIPDPPTAPTPRNKEKEIRLNQWYGWIDTWSQRLLNRLDDQDDDPAVEILLGMIECLPEKRWPANRCLGRGFQNGLFRRRAADDLVVNARDLNEAASQAEERDNEAITPRVASPNVASPHRTQAGIDPEATIILSNLLGGKGTANSPSASIEGSPSGLPTPA